MSFCGPSGQRNQLIQVLLFLICCNSAKLLTFQKPKVKTLIIIIIWEKVNKLTGTFQIIEGLLLVILCYNHINWINLNT